MSTVLDLLRTAGIEVHTRREWGSPRERDGSYARRERTHPINGPVSFHYLHLSVTPDSDTVQEGSAGARQIEGYGYSTPPMVSYQLLVTNEGRVFEGQNYGVKGTHTVNDKDVPGFPLDLNREGYAVALMQNVDDEVTDEQVYVVAACFAAAELAGFVKRGAPIFPHRKFAWKSCPGDKAVARLHEIQTLKDQMVRDGLGDDMSADSVWNADLAEYDSETKKDAQPARVLLAQAHNRAGDARREAAAAAQGVARLEKAIEALAAAIGPTTEAAVKAALAETLPDVIDVNVDVSVPGATK